MGFISQHHCVPQHTSTSTKHWFRQKKRKERPSQSPELNHLKRAVEKTCPYKLIVLESFSWSENTADSICRILTNPSKED
uniref:Uncharacterized protein n=1 Tax=Fundulus heteroclitus TaxID=8078 RepID=A0A3Q2UGG9_FUNHE